MNFVLLIGRLTKDVELRYAQGSGKPMARFTLAVDKNLSADKKREFEAQGRATADFIPCTAFGKTAELAAKYLRKGSKVATQGRIDVTNYEKDGEKKIFTSISVERLEFLDSKKSYQPDSEPKFEDVSSDIDIPF